MNIPIALTIIRLFLAPLAYYFGATVQKEAFLLIFALGGITDVLDGFLARRWKQVTKTGSSLDTVADVVFYPSAFMLYFFIPTVFAEYWVALAIVLILHAITIIATLLKKKVSMSHRISGKLCAASVYLFVLFTLSSGFSEWFFYAVLALNVFFTIDKLLVVIKK